jgi:hypothetical protein
LEIVGCEDGGIEKVDGNSRVLVAVHGCIEVKIFDIGTHESSAAGGNGTVDEEFDGGHFGTWRGCFAGVIDAITADGVADSERIFFCGR